MTPTRERRARWVQSLSEKCPRPIGANLNFVGESLRGTEGHPERSDGSALPLLVTWKHPKTKGSVENADSADFTENNKEQQRLFQKVVAALFSVVSAPCQRYQRPFRSRAAGASTRARRADQGAQIPPVESIAPHGNQRIDSRRAARWQPSGRERRRKEDECHHHVRQCIRRRDTIKKAGHDA